MRNAFLVVIILLPPAMTGCALPDVVVSANGLVSDMIFGAFGTGYSNGTSRADRYSQYNRDAQASGMFSN